MDLHRLWLFLDILNFASMYHIRKMFSICVWYSFIQNISNIVIFFFLNYLKQNTIYDFFL